MLVKQQELKNMDLSQFDWSKTEIANFKKKINEFKSYHEKSINQENFQAALNLCYSLICRVPLPMYYFDVNYLIRTRPNWPDEIFTEEWQISYNSRNTSGIILGRFNLPQEPMFYGCVASENTIRSYFLVPSCLESCKELLDTNNKKPFQYLTTGKWYLKEPFYVFNLCFNEKFLSENQKFREYVTQYIETLRISLKNEVTDFIVDFWYFLSDLAGKKSECEADHFLTTAFWCAVKIYFITVLKEEPNGIAFTSSMTDNSGVNIVMTTQAVDKYLFLKSAFMIKYTRKLNNPKSYDIKQCSDECVVDSNRFSLAKNF